MIRQKSISNATKTILQRNESITLHVLTNHCSLLQNHTAPTLAQHETVCNITKHHILEHSVDCQNNSEDQITTSIQTRLLGKYIMLFTYNSKQQPTIANY